jgi:hypothetical protein
MAGRRVVISVLLGVLAISAGVRADLTPAFPPEAGFQPSYLSSTSTDLQPAAFLGPFAGMAGRADLDASPIGLLSRSPAPAGLPGETKPAQITTDRQNSLTLCLYALLSLGLCRSAPLVKKFHVGCIPDWYHSDGPAQIGHSFAISPDCLTSAPVICFIQPDCEAEIVTPQYFRRAIVAALLRHSQFILIAFPSRGPPSLPHESSRA